MKTRRGDTAPGARREIGEKLFEKPDAAVRRVAALDTWLGYHPRLEAVLPQTDGPVGAIEALPAYLGAGTQNSLTTKIVNDPIAISLCWRLRSSTILRRRP